MIWESWPWKEALLRDANKLQRLILEADDEESQVAYERAIFLAGFTIRKLLEAKKLTDETAQCDVKCLKQPLSNRKKIPDRMNWHRLEEFYDFESQIGGTVKLSFFANQLVHSFIFMATISGHGNFLANGFFVNSDYDRGKFLYQYELAELLRIMTLVGKDEVQQSEFRRDDDGDWIVKNVGGPSGKLKGDK